MRQQHVHLVPTPDLSGTPEVRQNVGSTPARATLAPAPRDGVQARCAQALLACATGCTPERAAAALRTVAEHFEIDTEGAGAWFLRWMSIDAEYAEALVVRVAGIGLPPLGAARLRARDDRSRGLSVGASPLEAQPA